MLSWFAKINLLYVIPTSFTLRRVERNTKKQDWWRLGLNPTNKKSQKNFRNSDPIFGFWKLRSYQKFLDIIFRNLASNLHHKVGSIFSDLSKKIEGSKFSDLSEKKIWIWEFLLVGSSPGHSEKSFSRSSTWRFVVQILWGCHLPLED